MNKEELICKFIEYCIEAEVSPTNGDYKELIQRFLEEEKSNDD